jgi:AcrR family transcriptional regulator
MTAQRADAQKNREHLLAVARALMQKGNLAPSFNELAKRAGVGVGTVYRHFADQHALLLGLVEDQMAELAQLMERARAEKDPLVALEVLLRGALGLELDSPVIAQLLASPRRESRELAEKLAALESTAESVVARARRKKLIRADVKAGDLRRLVCGLELAARSGEEPAASAARYADIVLAGLRR